MVSFSSRISPETSTVILRDRSPRATAVVTSAMLRTCAVRLPHIALTVSVKSVQLPATPDSSAWPPSLPSVPTSRATRVTSDVKTPSCWIIVLTIVARRRNSPCNGRPSTSSRIVCNRSPRATAVIASVTALVGHSKSSISVLTELSISPQAPSDRVSLTRCRVFPSRPTTCPTYSSCCAIRWLEATISLMVSAILPFTPVASLGRRAEKSPRRTDCSAWSSCRLKASPSVAGAACPFPLTDATTSFIEGALGRLSEVTSTRPSAVGSMLNSCRVVDTTNAANEAAAGRYDPQGAELCNVLGGTTAGFPMPRNHSRDINSKDSLINYLRHPAGLFIERPDHSALRTAQGSPGLIHKAAFRNGGWARRFRNWRKKFAECHQKVGWLPVKPWSAPASPGAMPRDAPAAGRSP